MLDACSHPTVVPNKAPITAVAAIATAPQNVTRAAPTDAEAPPPRAAIAPSAARQIRDTAETRGTSGTCHRSMTVRSGKAAPTANVAADESAACNGRAAVL